MMPDLVKNGDESGVEVWEDPDRSRVEYRAPDGAVLRFEAFSGRSYLVQERIGAKITTRNSRFELAAIDSIYFVSGYGIKEDNDHDRDDTYLDEYESRLFLGYFPERVESLCRA